MSAVQCTVLGEGRDLAKEVEADLGLKPLPGTLMGNADLTELPGEEFLAIP